MIQATANPESGGRRDPWFLSLSFFAVLAVAHALMLSGNRPPFSLWTPVAYFWQDVLAALIYAAMDAAVRRNSLRWILYVLLVVYTAVNVPITWALSSPLTLPMIRAAGGPLSDSIAYNWTWRNFGGLALVLLSAIVLPLILTRLNLRPIRLLLAPALAFVAIGPRASSKVDTLGFHRNAFSALWPNRLPSVVNAHGLSDPRTSPFAERSSQDLSRYAGVAAGRNVILIILESTGARYLHAYGAMEDPTPNLSRLADQSILFENAYAVYPESIKGLDAVLCSRYPDFATATEPRNKVCHSLPERLKDAGYSTALFHSGRFDYLGMRSIVENRGFDVLEDAGLIGGDVNSSFGVDEPSTVRRIMSWVDSIPRSHPFFVAYLPIAGHHPYASSTPGPFDDRTEHGRYLNALHDGDSAIGEIIEQLQHRGLLEKSLFVIFGDHGEAFGQHEGNYGHTAFIYDENVHVPLMVMAPGLIPGQIRIRRSASLIDVGATLFDLLRFPAWNESPGVSLLRPDSRMALFFTDYSLGWMGLRDGCWKYIHEINAARSHLYDNCTDHDDQTDLAVANPQRVIAYRSTLQTWIHRTN